ncbi:hypothetical protein [Saccharothrix sp. ST-888]|uniref:hypothetical protein n=1 Tax=Saccharothrix sp. ST-888 TaxID=1427391 RepID=UPI0005ECC86C|nr:hypothetical protein [Saccharothrix sp. ST-888]KJK56706.1 hypothetical protein UK12_21015 [Saccharothrix sp. ST-888]
MRRRHSFHRDLYGHSITVNVRSGLLTETELLVNGKEVGFLRERGTGHLPRRLTGELPDFPARPFTVRLDRPAPGLRLPTCTLELEGRNLPMPDQVARPEPSAAAR